MHFIAIIIAASLLGIAGLHVYWGFGGKWAALATLPKREDATLLFQPRLPECLAVAFGLSATAWLALSRVQIISHPFTGSWSEKLLLCVTGVFALRCIGDFRYVGFFRKIRSTDFARMDRKFYTPLCAFYTLALAFIALRA